MQTAYADVSGMVTSVQRSSIHDGPGLRTTVFLKGCQLSCVWCHNPETISFEPQLMSYPEKCIGCGLCDEGCFSGAKVICGRRMSVAEVMSEVQLDRPYYGDNGGITLSGGEPLCQPEFSLALLQACKNQGIHTAIESNLCLPMETAEPVLKMCDLVMADLKLWDSKAHKQWTGSANELIIDNFRKLSTFGIPFIMRTPVIPGVNDTEAEIDAIASFAAGLKGLLYFELLSYHPLGVDKCRALGIEVRRFEQPAKQHMLELAEIAMDKGLRVFLNGCEAKAGGHS